MAGTVAAQPDTIFFFPLQLWKIHRSKNLKARIHAASVLFFDAGTTLHV
jgi:hypothetical protein